MVMELSEVMTEEGIEEAFKNLRDETEDRKRNASPARKRQVELMIAKFINGRLPYNKRNYNLGAHYD